MDFHFRLNNNTYYGLVVKDVIYMIYWYDGFHVLILGIRSLVVLILVVMNLCH